MEAVVSSFDDIFLLRIYQLADALKCTPIDVLDFVLRAGTVMSIIFGMVLMIFFDYFMRPVMVHVIDRVLDGLVALIRWLRSRRTRKTSGVS